MWSWAADKIDRTRDVKQRREGASVQNVTQLDAKCRVIEGNRLVNCSKMTRFLCCHPRSPCKWQALSFGGNCIISNKAFQGVGWLVGNVSWRWQSGMVWWGPRSKAIAADRLMKSLTNWDVSLMINWDHIKISHSREHQQIKDTQTCRRACLPIGKTDDIDVQWTLYIVQCTLKFLLLLKLCRGSDLLHWLLMTRERGGKLANFGA